MERDSWLIIYACHIFYFNSHAHVERDDIVTFERVKKGISTHTLTWSVTCIDEVADQCVEISTHTLTWSVTRAKGQLVISSINFNSHAHVERDASVPTGAVIIRNFNSHAHVERDQLARK